MLNNKKIIFESKKGQISETMTWVVATVIIFLILAAFVYSSGLFGKAKEITIDKINKLSKKDIINSAKIITSGEETSSYEKELLSWNYSDDKSIFAYALVKNADSKTVLYNSLKEKSFSDELIKYKLNLLQLNNE